ncbi:MAG: 2-amino-4-hydroxy-6-hydroxymethyldihydropteridine diphosphokinase [Flavobacteriales bacterium]|nr:2-amino-4-hydroxy-6-hydroxymethyldihydropteridine diphosphokinase [Flavobacteriales bacterium]|tara:strand:+ start:15377 stop:15868 length:492 start_codon:yes stop_codon:yes gene_type:complete
MNHISYISIGSNLGDRIFNCNTAIKMLANFSIIQKVSSFYETEAWGYDDHCQYINAVLKLKTKLHYKELLKSLQLIENKMGRNKKNNNIYESRIIDLDILFFDNLIIDEKDIVIPHPQLYYRNFVLKPFFEIAPNFKCPLKKKNIYTLLNISDDKNKVEIYAH